MSHQVKTLIAMKEVTKTYVKGRYKIPILQQLELNVNSGEVVCIMGPSGSGKSTLLDIISGIAKCDSGKIILAGTDISELSQTSIANFRAQHIGFIFQFYCLLPFLSAAENIEVPLHLLKMASKEKTSRVEAAISLVGMEHRRSHRPEELSGGEQQRIAIARALVCNPDIILCDEPTGDLDKETGLEIMNLIVNLSHFYKKGVVVVTHDPLISSMSDRTLHLLDGKLSDEKGDI